MRLLTTLLLLISVNALGQTKGALENPSPGSFTVVSICFLAGRVTPS